MRLSVGGYAFLSSVNVAQVAREPEGETASDVVFLGGK